MIETVRRLGLCPRPRGISGKMRGAAALLLLPGTGFADAWSVFEARCLAPLMEVEQPDLSGLTLLSSEDGFDVWGNGASATVTVPTSGTDQILSCSVSTHGSPAPVEGADRDWAEAALGSGLWENVTEDISHAPVTLRSTTWREPRMEVAFTVLTTKGEPRFVARETDLES